MAYTAAVTVVHLGGRDFKVTVIETDAGAATEVIIGQLPIKGVIVSQMASLITGTGTTIDPVVGVATNPGAKAVTTVIENDTAAAQISNLALPPVPFVATGGQLFMRSQCDAGSDNSVETVLLIKAGW